MQVTSGAGSASGAVSLLGRNIIAISIFTVFLLSSIYAIVRTSRRNDICSNGQSVPGVVKGVNYTYYSNDMDGQHINFYHITVRFNIGQQIKERNFTFSQSQIYTMYPEGIDMDQTLEVLVNLETPNSAILLAECK